MRKLIFGFFLLSCFSALSAQALAQSCDRTRMSPIMCGYYEEGYQDGSNDARRYESNDYRRYMSKLDSRYESYYRSGYSDGYAKFRQFPEWTDLQKNTYDQGYEDGHADKGRNISRLPARYEGQYDRASEQYYKRGYMDGYDNRPRQYVVPLTGEIPTPLPPGGIRREIPSGRGTTTGSATWRGRVDNRVNIIIKGNQIRTQQVAGPLITTYENLAGTLPRRNATVAVRKLDGRGTVFVLQQPNRSNDYTAIVQISDPQRGMDSYNLQINWTSVNTVEPYSAGKVTWKGRVDGTVAIRVNGDSVVSIDETASGLSRVSFETQGYLAARPGTVRVLKEDGRGSVYIAEQPSEANDYTAVIRISDPRRADDMYEIVIEW